MRATASGILPNRETQRPGVVQLLYDVAMIAGRARSVPQALQGTLERVGREFDWPLGHAYVPGHGGVFEFAGGIRRLESPGGEELILASQGARYRSGEGWIGRALEEGGPISIRDLRTAEDESGDGRRRLAVDLGLRGLFVVPIIQRGEALAVMEFFSSEPFEPAGDVVAAAAQISDHLGRMVERRRAENELDRARRRLASATRRGEDFFATASHRVRTPMNAVLGMTELLLHTPMTPEQRENLELLRESGDDLMATLDQVFLFLKLEWGAFELAREPFSLRGLIEEVIRQAAEKAPAKDLFLGYRLADSVPDALIGDAPHLRQVLRQLLDNAIEFTPAGEVAVTVETERIDGLDSGSPRCCRLEVAVRDTGAGIARYRMRDLFEPFSQIDAWAARRIGGTGLGLAICQRLCRWLGGELRVESEVGRGSVFRFSFDVEVSEPSAPGVGRGADEPRQPGEKGRDTVEAAPLDVLVVEDNPLNQKVALKMLAALNQEAEVVASGRQALELLSRRRFDVILMDVEMPGVDGLETTRRIRRQLAAEAQPYIVAMTARALPGAREQCLAAGMNGYIGKPATLRDLREALQEARRRSPGIRPS